MDCDAVVAGLNASGPTNMEENIRWLLAEIDRWQEQGLIAPEQAARLRNRYAPVLPGAAPAATASPTSTTPSHVAAREPVPWGLLVFSVAGAIVIGLGVILLFAYNWPAIPKAGKLTLVFGAIVAAHVAAAPLVRKDGWQSHLGEALAALGTMFYGAGIWLVAQIYHIDEHYPNGFLFWALGALAMSWALRSTANGLLAAVLFAIWGCTEAFDFRAPQFWAIPLIVGGVLPLAWSRRSALLLAVSLAAIQLLLAANLTIWGNAAYAFTASLAWNVLLVAAARFVAADRPDFGGGAGVLEFFGYGGFVVCGYILSFDDSVRSLLDWAHRPAWGSGTAPVFAWTLFGVGLTAWAAWLRRTIAHPARTARREDWLLPIALLYCFGYAAFGMREWDLLVSWSFNFVLLGIAVMWMWRGCQETRLKPTVVGSLLLAALVFARYFDLFQSLAERGFAFILLGTIFMIEAFYYRKMRRETGDAA